MCRLPFSEKFNALIHRYGPPQRSDIDCFYHSPYPLAFREGITFYGVTVEKSTAGELLPLSKTEGDSHGCLNTTGTSPSIANPSLGSVFRGHRVAARGAPSSVPQLSSSNPAYQSAFEVCKTPGRCFLIRLLAQKAWRNNACS